MKQSVLKGRLSSLLAPFKQSALTRVASGVAAAVLISTSAAANPIVVSTMSDLKAINVSALTNDTVALMIDYYTPSQLIHVYGGPTRGRGGGIFRWRAGATDTSDDGRIVAPNVNSSYGRWERMLQGEAANVKMWGAKGDGQTDDSDAIQRAVDGCAWYSGELVFPTGTYLITNTILFYGTLHLRGEGQGNNTMIVMNAEGKDAFRTRNAQAYFDGQATDWDHWLVFENFYIKFMNTNTANTNAALTLCRPGEGNSIRNITTVGGGFGIRCMGVGAPGLRIRDCSTHLAQIAGVSIEGLPLSNGDTWEGNGSVSLLGVSGDAPLNNTNTSLIRIYKCRATTSVYDLKAEGIFGAGVIQYHLGGSSTTYNSSMTMGSLSVRGGIVNAGSTYTTDFIVLRSDNARTPSILLEPCNLYGVRDLIRDEVTGRRIEADITTYTGLSQLALRLPTAYEGYIDHLTSARTRYVVGQTALYTFIPPTNGWYRVMESMAPTKHIAGKLTMSSWRESTEIHADVSPWAGTNGSLITVARSTINAGWHPPIVTKARAGAYRTSDYSGYSSFVDIYVENPIASSYHPKEKRLTLALDINGLETLDYGAVQLLCPTQPVIEMFPPGMIVLNSNQVPVVRQ